jgi:plasmid stability protein
MSLPRRHGAITGVGEALREQFRRDLPHAPPLLAPSAPQLGKNRAVQIKRRAARRLSMCCTCDTVEHMSKMIQIRNVPDELHRKLKVRAAERGTSLSDFLLAEVEEIADRPTVAELMERLSVEEPVDVDEPPEVTIRRLRETG